MTFFSRRSFNTLFHDLLSLSYLLQHCVWSVITVLITLQTLWRNIGHVESDVDRVALSRLTFRFFDDVSTAS